MRGAREAPAPRNSLNFRRASLLSRNEFESGTCTIVLHATSSFTYVSVIYGANFPFINNEVAAVEPPVEVPTNQSDWTGRESHPLQFSAVCSFEGLCNNQEKDCRAINNFADKLIDKKFLVSCQIIGKEKGSYIHVHS